MPSLYELKGYDIPAEFGDEKNKNDIEKDIKNFDKLPEYTPKKFSELDHNSPNLHLEITREVLNRAKDNSHSDFFAITDDIKNSG